MKERTVFQQYEGSFQAFIETHCQDSAKHYGGKKVLIRRANSNDAVGIARFYYRCPYSFFRGSLTDVEILCSTLPFWVAEQRGTISGFIFSSNYDESYAWISGLGIPERNDKNNVGKNLVTALEKHFRDLTGTVVVRETPQTKKWVRRLFLDKNYKEICPILAYEMQLSNIPPIDFNEDAKHVRTARKDEIGLIKAIDAQCFPGLFRYSHPAFTKMFENASIRLIALDPATRNPIGFLLAYIYQNGYGNVTRIAILPSYRRKGLGKQLMESCINKMSKRDVRTITLNTQEHNVSARTLYKKLGFTPTGNETVFAKTLTSSIPE
ncbi:MAG: GNAT family N-acetyltransferase [Candidatus Hodarchaeales archaeon]